MKRYEVRYFGTNRSSRFYLAPISENVRMIDGEFEPKFIGKFPSLSALECSRSHG